MIQKIKSNETSRIFSLRHVEAHRAETSHDTTTSPSSSGLTRGSTGTNAESESGRSMVEMLGTLAIMGVLAIGGVAGYRYAMDKLNANTIVDEVRKRAVTASQQRLLGRDIDLREFGSPDRISGAYQVYPLDRYNNSASFFGIDVTSIPQGICDHILKNKPQNCIEVLVNDTQTDTCPDGESDLTFAFANTLDPNVAALPEPETRCYDNSDCTNSARPYCGKYEYCEPCPDETPKWNGRSCEACSGSKPAWNETECVECTTNEHCANNTKGKFCLEGNTCGCLSNDACDTDDYCEIHAKLADLGAGDNGTCFTDYRGTCKNKGIQPDPVTLQAAGETTPFATVYKGPRMNSWWSAVNYCQSHNLKQFDVNNNRMRCSHTESQIKNGNIIGTSGTIARGYCQLEGNGDPSFADPAQPRSLRMVAFMEQIESTDKYWVSSLYNRTGATTCTINQCDSCHAFLILPADGSIMGNLHFHDNDTYALCEE